MPLPKPPAKRADFLSPDAFDAPGAAGKRARRERPAAEPVAPALLELSNQGQAQVAALPPAVLQAPPPPASIADRARNARRSGRAATARQRCSSSTPTC